MTKIYYLDGDYVNAEDAAIPVTDLAIVRGYGVFDFFRTYNGIPIQVERNIERLRNSAQVLDMELPWTNDEIKQIVLETVARNGFEEANIRVIVTGGDSSDFLTPEDNPRLLVYVEPLKPLPEWWYTNGVKVITVRKERYLPQAKSLNYIPAIMALKKARAESAIEALYVDDSDCVREGTTTNLFAFYGDKVITPAVDILPGITRGRVIDILSQDYMLVERDLPYEELMRADEVVITAANKQVVPVIQIDQQPFSGGQPGQRSRKLMDDFQQYVMQQAQAQLQV